MHSRQLLYLRLVISTGSYGAAAQAAGVSQPAITQAMQSLEAECGYRLFHKSGRRRVPNSAALSLARQAEALQQHLDATQPASQHPADAAPSLRVGMSPAAALMYSPSIDDVWRRHAPDGLLEISTHSAREMLRLLQHGELDLVAAPRPRRFEAHGIQSLPLYQSEPTIYARAGHPLGQASSLQDIQSAGWAVSGRGGTPGNVIEEAHLVRKMPAPRIVLRCADYLTLLDLVAQSDMLCVVPHPALLQHRHRKALQALNIVEGLPQYEVCLFWRSLPTPHLGGVVDEVVAQLSFHTDTPAPD